MPSFIILLPELVLSKVWEQGIMMVNCSQVFTGERLADNILAPLNVFEIYNYNYYNNIKLGWLRKRGMGENAENVI